MKKLSNILSKIKKYIKKDKKNCFFLANMIWLFTFASFLIVSVIALITLRFFLQASIYNQDIVSEDKKIESKIEKEVRELKNFYNSLDKILPTHEAKEKNATSTLSDAAQGN